jgi:hypothetical protein
MTTRYRIEVDVRPGIPALTIVGTPDHLTIPAKQRAYARDLRALGDITTAEELENAAEARERRAEA